MDLGAALAVITRRPVPKALYGRSSQASKQHSLESSFTLVSFCFRERELSAGLVAWRLAGFQEMRSNKDLIPVTASSFLDLIERLNLKEYWGAGRGGGSCSLPMAALDKMRFCVPSCWPFSARKLLRRGLFACSLQL
jgi:hypothetical protein